MEATLELGDLVLSGDQTNVRFHLPPLPIDGQPEPVHIQLNFDADMVEQLLEQLTLLYAQMEPLPRKGAVRIISTALNDMPVLTERSRTRRLLVSNVTSMSRVPRTGLLRT